MKSSAKRPSRSLPHTLRIIGGTWRGRKLTFPPIAAIRPTPDRVRETVFNWLQHDIVGARCLDLFAGSGALGLEALSRGAAHVTFVDNERKVETHLRDTLQKLAAVNAEVRIGDALQWLTGPTQAFDIVFLDPPFASDLLSRACERLEIKRWLSPRAIVYMESASAAGDPAIPKNWQLLKSKSAGQVGYYLARRSSP